VTGSGGIFDGINQIYRIDERQGTKQENRKEMRNGIHPSTDAE
jgi:hypothetical protein